MEYPLSFRNMYPSGSYIAMPFHVFFNHEATPHYIHFSLLPLSLTSWAGESAVMFSIPWMVVICEGAQGVWVYREAEKNRAFATPPPHYLSLLRWGFNLGRQAGGERVILTLKTCWLKLVLWNSIPLNAFGPEPRGLALTSTDTVSSAGETCSGINTERDTHLLYCHGHECG